MSAPVPERISLGQSLQISRVLTGLWQVADIETSEGQVHRWIVPAAMLIGVNTEAMKTLANLGLQIGVKKEEPLRVLIGSWRPRSKYRTIERLGWTDATLTAFALGDGRIVSDRKSEPVVVADSIPVVSAIRSSGTFENWQRDVAAKAIKKFADQREAYIKTNGEADPADPNKFQIKDIPKFNADMEKMMDVEVKISFPKMKLADLADQKVAPKDVFSWKELGILTR